MSQKRIMVAITGASGAIYAKRLLEYLPHEYDTVYLAASDNASEIVRAELGVQSVTELIAHNLAAKVDAYENSDILAPPASGSHDYDGLVCVPCSMGALGRIASGISNTLITRAADVCLKERRKLILVVRETPYSLVHLRNMTALTEAGATILPATPAFYNGESTMQEMVDFVVDRVLQSIGSQTRISKRWKE